MWIHLLIGCPFIFGPPNMSQVDIGDPLDGAPPSDATEPTDPTTATGTTAVTGDTGAVGLPPEITALEVQPSIDGLAFRVAVADADGNMEGGDVTIDGAGPTIVMEIPEDVIVANGQMEFVIPGGDPCQSWEYTFQVVVHDVAGNPSPMTELVAVGGGSGQAPQGPSVLDLGNIEPDWVACGGIESFNEHDRFTFSPFNGGLMQFSLSWNTGMGTDLDMTLYEGPVYIISGASVVEPELMQAFLTAGAPYTVEVYHFSGQRPSQYQLLFTAP